jgi:hypothetical protein
MPDSHDVADRPEAEGPGDGRAAGLTRQLMGFAAHIRDPENQPPPKGLENRRLAIYRRLFFNNVSSLLAGNFPVLRSLLDDERWRRLVRDFYSEHRCRTPLFPEVAKEFLRYLQDHRGIRPDDPPFLPELAHYEWVELALELDERELDDIAADPDGDLLEGIPVLSPLAWPLSYRFPVHCIRPDHQPDEPPSEATHLLVYRNRSDEVRFMQLNPVTRLLLAQLSDAPGLTGNQHFQRIAGAIDHPEPARLLAAGADVFSELRDRDVLLGTRPENPAPEHPDAVR